MPSVWLCGSIFYSHSVVGEVLNSMNVIYGARTHSAWRYGAYTCLYNCKNIYIYIIVKILYFLYKYVHAVGSVGSHPDA